MAKGAIGDAFMQLEQTSEALSYYQSALGHSDNEFTTPKFLHKAAVAAAALGQKEKAATYIAQIKTDFPNALEAASADALLGLMNGDK